MAPAVKLVFKIYKKKTAQPESFAFCITNVAEPHRFYTDSSLEPSEPESQQNERFLWLRPATLFTTFYITQNKKK
jgi:16S rRNA C1402 N4-methylase RsmH